MSSFTFASKTVLHVGCGPVGGAPLHFSFAGWQEIRLDIDPDCQPDIVASITDMAAVPDASVDGAYSAHNLEHLPAHEVPMALREFYRVLRPGGHVLLTMPDLQSVAMEIASGADPEGVLYESPAGPVAAIDVLYGYRPALAAGKAAMAHRTGFTAATLGRKLTEAGFQNVRVQANPACFSLWAVGYRLVSTATMS